MKAGRREISKRLVQRKKGRRRNEVRKRNLDREET